jgi:hypothetical protein
MSRIDDLISFYRLLETLESKQGGKHNLALCSGRMQWPDKGVYFFFEKGEHRSDSGSGLRVVRIGTHALTATSKTSLWKRLSQHRGNANGQRGNHRGSIFRLLVGNALQTQDVRTISSWGVSESASAAATKLGVHQEHLKAQEMEAERAVSRIIGEMPFIWLGINDAPGPDSLRGYVERNAIALLSNAGKIPLDPPSRSWLGQYCDREKVRESGLWNNRHTDDTCDPDFLDKLSLLI